MQFGRFWGWWLSVKNTLLMEISLFLRKEGGFRMILKKPLFWTFLLVCLLWAGVQARPAYPGLIESKQPDGSTINIRKVGNEYFHYVMTEDSLVVVRDTSGFWNYADSNGKSVGVRAHAKAHRGKNEMDFVKRKGLKRFFNKRKDRAFRDNAFSSSSVSALRRPGFGSSSSVAGIQAVVTQPIYSQKLTVGNIRVLVMLVEFSDVQFKQKDAKDLYNRFMNEPGFSEFANVGSVRDYFIQNSDSVFTPSFDVIGPIRLHQNRDYYGNDESSDDPTAKARVAMIEALDSVIARGTTDFSLYDNDGDGNVDFVYMVYAGVGASDSDVSTAIWPHASYIKKRLSQNVSMDRYACSNEISGTAYSLNRNTSSIDGIGGFVHEFSHILGLMDTYDIYYSDTTVFTPYEWDLMDMGTYNCTKNKYYVMSCSPPHMNAFERYTLGWLTPRTLFETDKSLELLSIEKNDGIVLPSRDPNEYYFLDYHLLKGFDSALPNHGMLVWHIAYDKDVWSKNEINSGKTQRLDIIEADGKADYNTTKGDAFPGTARKTSFNEFYTLLGKDLGVMLTNITETDSSVKFDVAFTDGELVFVSSSSVESSSSANTWIWSASSSSTQSIRKAKGRMDVEDLRNERYFDLNGRQVPPPKKH